MTAQDCGREQAPRGTKQNFGCREEPLRNLGYGRPGPSAASRRLRHRAQQPRAAPRPAAAGLERTQPWGRRLDPSPDRGPHGHSELERAGDADGGTERATSAGRPGEVGPGGDPEEPTGPGRRPREWSCRPAPGWGRPWPCSLTFLEACALPSSGGRSPEHVRGGVRGRAGDGEPGASAGGTTQPGLSPSPRPLPSCPGG